MMTRLTAHPGCAVFPHTDYRSSSKHGYATSGATSNGARRAPADAALLGHLEIAAALVVAAIEIVGFGDAGLRRCRLEGVEDLPGEAGLLDRRFGYYSLMIPLTVGAFAVGFVALILIGSSWWALAVAGFLGLAVVLTARFGNHGLWCAMLAFMALRAITLALRLPEIERKSFAVAEDPVEA